MQARDSITKESSEASNVKAEQQRKITESMGKENVGGQQYTFYDVTITQILLFEVFIWRNAAFWDIKSENC